MNRLMTVPFACIVAIFLTGCASTAPTYTASIENVQTLKRAGNLSTKVGTFASSPDKGNANPISVRGTPVLSPYQDSYANYVAEAIKQELSLAQKLTADSKTEITGTLLKNDLDTSGFSTGYADISARFVVKQGPAVRYDQTKTVRHEFPSSFAGAVAIPRAIQEYPAAVQKLLSQLYADKDFLSALK